ncbi:FAD/NAD(P)-binding domain-containing protein [Massarina eburnea CBS 473.64]|uniref:FAD/NAD(P)-binding domain-containing protein n=1 Tax=Massarina eburnea CBS 473.64 TaxID=1395130 RepID=A0A6A6RL55_9PLEO|nr:FAD/NAD(P)-binding domain-containing protein [Massarina eburnea CBS 473.64]
MATTNGTPHQNGTSAHLPVVIAGGGCVGLFLAHLLAQSEIPNPIIVIEPTAPDLTSTRAMAHQPIMFPLFARAGLMPELTREGTFSSSLCFRTSVANGSKVLAGKVFKEGEKAQLLLPQGRFQDVLVRKVEGSGKGSVRWGWRVIGFEERGDQGRRTGRVDVRVQNGSGGEEEVIEAVYLVGADGAHSQVRKSLNFAFPGETLSTQLVATDVVYDFRAQGFYDANFVVDPELYGLIGRIDDAGLWRVSYGVPAETSEEEIRRDVGLRLRRMMPDDGAAGFEVKRVAPYKAQQRGRVADGGIVTNPYAGLGLASGIADVSSLAAVLIRILSSEAADADKLFLSWSLARRQRFNSVVDKPSRAAYARVRTKVDTEDEIKAMLENDPLVSSLDKGMPVMPPSLETKVEELVGW